MLDVKSPKPNLFRDVSTVFKTGAGVIALTLFAIEAAQKMERQLVLIRQLVNNIACY